MFVLLRTVLVTGILWGAQHNRTNVALSLMWRPRWFPFGFPQPSNPLPDVIAVFCGRSAKQPLRELVFAVFCITEKIG